MHVEEPWRTSRHELECLMSLRRRNLFPAIPFRDETREFG